MTNPNDAVGTNAAYGTRTSVDAFNDVLQVINGRGILSGWAVLPKSGMTVSVGGVAGTRDVAIAEDNLGNRTAIDNRLGSTIDITLAAASISSARYSAIVAYVNNPAQAGDTTQDAPSVCGIIEAQGNSTGVSEAQIRTAITADGGTGSVAYYAVLATIHVGQSATTITGANITQTYLGANIPDGVVSTAKVANTAITTAKIADGAITAQKIDNDSTTLTDLPAHSAGVNDYMLTRTANVCVLNIKTIWVNSAAKDTWIDLGKIPATWLPNDGYEPVGTAVFLNDFGNNVCECQLLIGGKNSADAAKVRAKVTTARNALSAFRGFIVWTI